MTDQIRSFVNGQWIPKDEITDVSINKEQFDYLMTTILSCEQPQAWRAGWMVNHNTKRNDPRLQPFLHNLIKALGTDDQSHQRELLRLIEKMELDEELEGEVFDKCVSIWEGLGRKPSVRMMAFRIIFSIAKKYPELKQEIEVLVTDHYTDSLTPGVLRVVRKLFREL